MAHEPMAMAHLGSGIWSQSFLTRGAIFTVMVPAMTMTSHCLGVPRAMVPIRSMSKRPQAAAMNSIPQQLVAIGKTHRELDTPQVRILSAVVRPMSAPGIFSM